ncbi:hypothetical protein GF327_06835, partial [Candidatus Woesearchaeota archaeon]|nr:hypothetical protein [Candidatus Woesearchaeota archaeon]
MKFKKGQITLILIIGLVILSSLGVIIYINSSGKKDTLKADELATMNFASVRGSVQFYVSECLKLNTLSAMKNYGIQGANIDDSYEWYIENNLKSCLKGFEEFKNAGYEIEEEDVKADVRINDKSVVVKVNYPVTVSKGDIRAKIDYYQFSINPLVSVD